MKKITYSYPKSSFLSAEKDMGIIVNTMLKNERLKKMLHYTTKDCLNKKIPDFSMSWNSLLCKGIR